MNNISIKPFRDCKGLEDMLKQLSDFLKEKKTMVGFEVISFSHSSDLWGKYQGVLIYKINQP